MMRSDRENQFVPGKLWSLWEMLKLNAGEFYVAVTLLQESHTYIEALKEHDEFVDPSKIVAEEVGAHITGLANDLLTSLKILDTRVTAIAVENLLKMLWSGKLTYGALGRIYNDINSRLQVEQGIAVTHRTENEIFEQFLCRQFSDIYYPNTSSRRHLMESLVADALIHDDLQGGFDITNLFAILAAKDLHQFKTVSHKAGRVVVFKGRDKTEGLEDETGQTGYAITFPRMLSYVMDKVSGKEIFVHGVRKKERFYPEIAIREFLCQRRRQNASVRRSKDASVR